MMPDITIEFEGGQRVTVRLRSEPTETIRRLIGSLPFKSRAQRWGEEVYFEAPFHTALEKDARELMDVGAVAYWPDGDAIAIFFGRTPASEDDRPRAYSPCNIVGEVEGDVSPLHSVKPGALVQVTSK